MFHVIADAATQPLVIRMVGILLVPGLVDEVWVAIAPGLDGAAAGFADEESELGHVCGSGLGSDSKRRSVRRSYRRTETVNNNRHDMSSDSADLTFQPPQRVEGLEGW